MATLPALRPCFGCGNNTRFSLDDGRAFCTNCMELKNNIAREQYETRADTCENCHDPRRSTLTLVSVGWLCDFCLNA